MDQPEIRELGIALRCEQHIGGFDVSVHQAQSDVPPTGPARPAEPARGPAGSNGPSRTSDSRRLTAPGTNSISMKW